MNQLQIETSLSYNLPHGWYLLTEPTFSAELDSIEQGPAADSFWRWRRKNCGNC